MGLPIPVRSHQLVPFPEAYSQFPGCPVWLRGGGQYIHPPPEEAGRVKSMKTKPCRLPLLFWALTDTHSMIDTGTILDQVVSHFNVVVDDGLQQRGPQVFVLGVHFGTGL